MKKQLFIFGFAVAMVTNAMAFDERSMFDETQEESKWTFVEKAFITAPAEYKKAVWAHVESAVTGLIAVTAATVCGSLYFYNNDQFNNQLKDTLSIGNVSGGAALAATALSAKSSLECYLANQAHRNAVENFFNNWEQNQYFVPAELQDAFDAIAEMIDIESQDAVLNHANEIVNTIQFIVMRHFGDRYKAVLTATAVNSLVDTKTAGEILKNAIETAGKLGGGK
ncbi:MAG: hypothetical protein Q8Q60_03380 [Candidatus Chromulinivorax sp.]|nr:hypothetical protein [Candidatus Chromulinivorax sp.]